MVFKKLGFLALVIPYGLGMLAQFTIAEDGLSAGMGYITGAILIYFLGRKLNKVYLSDKANQKSLLDKIDSKHSLFYVRLEYWSIFWIVIGILVIVPNSEYAFDKTIQFFGFVLIIIGILALLRLYKRFTQLYKEKTTLIKYEPNILSDEKIKIKEAITKIKETEVKTSIFQPSDHDRYKPK